jgi:hypothetical protein
MPTTNVMMAEGIGKECLTGSVQAMEFNPPHHAGIVKGM